MTIINTTWSALSQKGDSEIFKAGFTDNIRRERIPITYVTIKNIYT